MAVREWFLKCLLKYGVHSINTGVCPKASATVFPNFVVEFFLRLLRVRLLPCNAMLEILMSLRRVELSTTCMRGNEDFSGNSFWSDLIKYQNFSKA